MFSHFAMINKQTSTYGKKINLFADMSCLFRAMEIFINLKLMGDSLQLQTAAPNSKFAVTDQNGEQVMQKMVSRILCFLVSSKLLGSLLIGIKVTSTPILLHTSSWLLSISLWFWSS